MSIKLKITSLLLLIFILGIGNGFYLVMSEKNAQTKLDWVIHTHKVLDKGKAFLGFITDVETRQRGYLLTLDTAYLELFDIGVYEAKKSLETLNHLTQDNQKQQMRLLTIKTLMEKKIEELTLTIDLVANDKKTQALDIVKSNDGKIIMDQIRMRMKDFFTLEELLLVERESDYKKQQRMMWMFIFLQTILILVFIVTIWIVIKSLLLTPLEKLLYFTQKIKSGNKLTINDVFKQDEMGHLMSSFYMMSEKIYSHTQELKHKAHYDSLTGLPNRIFAYEKLDSITMEQNPEHKTAICFMDLNKFKVVNDTLGHEVGDQLLCIAAQRLKESVRLEDTVCRLGGDEFLILLSNLTHLDQAVGVINDIHESFEKEVIISGEKIELSGSVGISIFNDDATNSSELLKKADIAMYDAKRNKKRISHYKKEMEDSLNKQY